MPTYQVAISRKDEQELPNGNEVYICNMIADDDGMAKISALHSFKSLFKDGLDESDLEITVTIKQ